MRLLLNHVRCKRLRQAKETASRMVSIDGVKQICGTGALAEGRDGVQIAAEYMAFPSLVDFWRRSWLQTENGFHHFGVIQKRTYAQTY